MAGGQIRRQSTGNAKTYDAARSAGHGGFQRRFQASGVRALNNRNACSRSNARFECEPRHGDHGSKAITHAQMPNAAERALLVVMLLYRPKAHPGKNLA